MTTYPILADGHQRAGAAFRARFGASPHLMIRAPGRVHLLGEQTEHQDGCSMALATECALWLAARPRSDGRVIVHSVDLKDSVEFSVIEPEEPPVAWRQYVKGVAWSVREAGWPISGWEGCVASDIPRAAGLASSSALALAVARAFAESAVRAWDPAAAARCCQRAATEWVGATVGRMDAWPAALAQRGCAMLLDARSLTSEPVPMPKGFTVVLLETGPRQIGVGLVDLERATECRVAAQRIGVASLRDVTLTQYARKAPDLDEVSKRRARHVVTEGDRVRQAILAMQRGDGDGLGIMLNMSHASLRDDFDVSDPLVEKLVRVARDLKGCAGARITGGRTSGLVLALVNNWALGPFLEQVGPAFQAAAGAPVKASPTAAAAGLSLS